ncbi:MAG: tyrosine-type recombinase/integrase [Patescibacteria group bacterium]
MSFEDLHQKFLDFLRKQGRANATVLAYGKDIEQLLEFLKEREVQAIDTVSTDHIEEFKDSLKRLRYTPKSISRKINSIKTFFRFLKREDHVNQNPAEAVIHPKYEQNSPRILTKMEYRALRDACKNDVRIAAIVELLLQTGMRISELAGLQMPDVDLEKSHVRIREQNSQQERNIPLNNACKVAMQSYLKIRPKTIEQETVFLTKTCRPFLVRNIRAAIDRFFRVAGIAEAKVNDLRHTFIVEQLKAGTPLTYVSRLVGHKRVTTTEKYLEFVNALDIQKEHKLEEL